MSVVLGLAVISSANKELEAIMPLVAEYVAAGAPVSETIVSALKDMPIPDAVVEVRRRALAGENTKATVCVLTDPVFAQNKDDSPIVFETSEGRAWLFQTLVFDKVLHEVKGAFTRKGTVPLEFVRYKSDILVTNVA